MKNPHPGCLTVSNQPFVDGINFCSQGLKKIKNTVKITPIIIRLVIDTIPKSSNIEPLRK